MFFSMEVNVDSSSSLANRYRDYIACLNRQDWDALASFVSKDVRHNDEPVGLSGYREMLKDNYRKIPDLHFYVSMLVCEHPHIASILSFNCTPVAKFLGLSVNGQRVSFTENVFYRLGAGKIEAVWSIVDKAAIEAQLAEQDAA